jgi:hypothetical protein
VAEKSWTVTGVVGARFLLPNAGVALTLIVAPEAEVAVLAGA